MQFEQELIGKLECYTKQPYDQFQLIGKLECYTKQPYDQFQLTRNLRFFGMI